MLVLAWFSSSVLSQQGSSTIPHTQTSASDPALQSNMDSMIIYYFQSRDDSTLSQKTVFEYDVWGQKILEINCSWVEALQEWNPNTMSEYGYDQSGNMTSHYQSSWDELATNWGNIVRTLYEYDTSGNQIQWIQSFGHSSSNEFEDRTMFTMQYNNSQKLTQSLLSYWDVDHSIWSQASKVEYSYDQSMVLDSSISYLWDEALDDWLRSGKTEYTYWLDGGLESDIQYLWETNISDWALQSKTVHYHNSNEDPTNDQYFVWNPSLLDWTPLLSLVYGYDTEGRQKSTSSSSWNQSLDVWEMTYFEEYLYDSHGNQIIDIGMNVTAATGTFELDSKIFRYYTNVYYTFEATAICDGDTLDWQGMDLTTTGEYTKNYVSVQGFDSIYEVHLIVEPTPAPFSITGEDEVTPGQIEVYTAPVNSENTYHWWLENGDILSKPAANSVEVQWENEGEAYLWGIAENQFHCWSEISELTISIVSTGTEGKLGEGILLFPNPTHSNLKLRIPADLEIRRIEVVDMSGARVLEQTISNITTELQTDPLPPGVYLLKLEGTTDFYLKFIKR